MTIAIGIVAHEKRKRRHGGLISATGAEVFNLDDGTLGCEKNHLVVLDALLNRQASASGPAWAVVLEDDAIPVPDFRVEVAHALSYAPAPIVGLYLGTGNPSGEVQRQIRQAVVSAHDKRAGWIVADFFISGVGYAIRMDLLPGILAWIADRTEELPMRITRWAQLEAPTYKRQDWAAHTICYTQPSLVDHEDSPPINPPYGNPRPVPGHNYMARKAWYFGERRQCWCTPTVRLGWCPHWSPPLGAD